MEQRPAFAAQFPDHCIRRSDRQGHHQKKADHADGDKRAIGNVTGNAQQLPVTVAHDVGQQMEKAVEEGQEPDQAALFEQPVPAKNPAQWGDEQREHQKNQRQHAGRAGDKLQGICPQFPPPAVHDQEQGGQQSVEENDLSLEMGVGAEIRGH